ncbi:MAG: pilus assembly protein [Peptococcaceae bacterium]|nr:pilus assembly protein [Peptococcaceae bacterium]
MKWLFFKNQRGQAMVELALVLPILLILFMGVIEFGRIFHHYLIITNASREGARVAILGKSDDDIKDRVRFVASDLDSSELQISVDPDSAARKSGILATVDVSYRMPLVFPFFGAFIPDPLTITSGTTMRME